MDPVSSALIFKALDGLSLRAAYTAQNIANANSPGYRSVHVAFEDNLRAAAARGHDAIVDSAPPTLIEDGDGVGEMRLDLELATASQTAMRYRALIDILGRQMSLARAVVSDQGR